MALFPRRSLLRESLILLVILIGIGVMGFILVWGIRYVVIPFR